MSAAISFFPGRDCVFGASHFNHFGGRHCETSAARKVLAHAGAEYTEEFLFGMAGGVGFVFWKQAGMKTPFVGGRNGKFPDYIESLGLALGHKITVVQTNSERRAYAGLITELGQGRPVVCYGDIHYLPYFHTQRHFGGHAFVVYAIDEPNNKAWISDRGEYPRLVTLQQLAQSRASKTTVFSPKNAQLRLEVNPASKLSVPDIWQAIHKSYQAMCEPPISNFGLAGLEKLGKWLRQAIQDLPERELCELLISLYVNLELAGTGGCAFRSMYHQFLIEVRQWIAPRPIDEALDYFQRSIQSWTVFINGLLPPVGFATMKLAEELQAKERAFEQATTDGVQAAATHAKRVAELIQSAAVELTAARKELQANTQNLAEISRWEAAAFQVLERARMEQR